MPFLIKSPNDKPLPLQALPDGRWQQVILRPLVDEAAITSTYLPLVGSLIFTSTALASDPARSFLANLILVDAHERINFSGSGERMVALVFETVGPTPTPLFGGHAVARDMPGVFKNIATTGNISASSATLTVASSAGLLVGQTIAVIGAGIAGQVLLTSIAAISGTTLTLTLIAGTDVSAAVVLVRSQAAREYLYRFITQGDGASPVWRLPLSTPYYFSTTGGITSGLAALTVASAIGLFVTQLITVAGAGAAGGLLTTTILAISGNIVTVANVAGTTVSGAAVSSPLPSGQAQQYLTSQESDGGENAGYSRITRIYRELPDVMYELEEIDFSYPGSLNTGGNNQRPPVTRRMFPLITKTWSLGQPNRAALQYDVKAWATEYQTYTPIGDVGPQTDQIRHEGYLSDGYAWSLSGGTITFKGVPCSSVTVSSGSTPTNTPSGWNVIRSEPRLWEGDIWELKNTAIDFSL